MGFDLKFEGWTRPGKCTLDTSWEEAADGKVMSIAGRVLAKRVFGKLAFFTLQDETGIIQLYLDKTRIDEGMESVPDAFEKLKMLIDIGDIIGVKGTMKRTEKGEISIMVQEWQDSGSIFIRYGTGVDAKRLLGS
eukprot:tig00001164_g7394.t1